MQHHRGSITSATRHLESAKRIDFHEGRKNSYPPVGRSQGGRKKESKSRFRSPGYGKYTQPNQISRCPERYGIPSPGEARTPSLSTRIRCVVAKTAGCTDTLGWNVESSFHLVVLIGSIQVQIHHMLFSRWSTRPGAKDGRTQPEKPHEPDRRIAG